ncbi:polysaccharide lyase family 8 super-sandwich domain-containing protein [Dysgonomonas sp. 520]|uniref:polysaccharide lyase family 8 super-sandwich domain-containing protein n=1 Tax=Dysgonomonas sp. 520 TaxID=2302931 RepID=UPI0013D38FCB|nr:polysaccharide lyase family 8 super-sandwich domain-containing protein [Dysgonomonas sp. 520]NDW11124.1 T9SS C-terminal target domain-containing protein [Dysgonomonas sp. 520]
MKNNILFLIATISLFLFELDGYAQTKISSDDFTYRSEGSDEAYAFDGDNDTYWQSTSAAYRFFEIDLKKKYKISKVIIKWEGEYFATTIQVFAKADPIEFGTTSSSFEDKTNGTEPRPTAPVINTYDGLSYDGVRYIGFWLRGRNIAGGNYRIKEIEIYGEEDGPSNVAMNKTATSPNGVTVTGSNPANAFDGDEGTYWQSSTSFKQQLFVDLGDRYDISKIVLKWDDVYYATTIDIVYSDIPITIDNVDNVSRQSYNSYNEAGIKPITNIFEDGKKVGITNLTFSKFTARYVGIQTRGRNANFGGDHYRLKEFEVYGMKNETAIEQPILDPDKQDALDIITNKLITKALTGFTSDTNPTNFFNSMLENGSWSDINYEDKKSGDGWSPATHLTRLGTMAVAFRTVTSAWYENAEMLEKIEKGLLYYKAKDPKADDNWWYYDIGDPQKYMVPTILLKGYSSYQNLMNISGYLRDGTTNVAHQGQNLAWIAEIVTYKGCIENDFELTKKSFDKMASILKIVSTQGGEGIKIDGSFHQHHEQLYSGGYGLSVTDYLSASMELATGTLFSQSYTPEKIEIFRNMLLEGHRLLGYRTVMDFGTIGRNISRSGAGVNISSTVLDRMIVADPEKAEDYQAWKEHLSGAPTPIEGNKYFWKSDIMTHRGTNYYMSTKIISKRTYGTESLGGENLLGYNLPMGATNILTHGAEYKGIFPIWEWNKVPGTTSAQDENAPKMSDGYLIGSNSFGGGVSSRSAGVIAYEHYYKGLNANKAYFMFGDAMLCLGSNIRLNSEVEVSTFINQCFLKGDVFVSTGGNSSEKIGATTSNSYTNLRWIHHDNIGYIFPEDADITVKNQRQQGRWLDINSAGTGSMVRGYVFNAWISHGVAPTAGTYQYIVAPDKSLENFQAFAQNHGFVVIRNDNIIQAVRNDISQKAGIVFHTGGTVDLGNGLTINSNKAILVLIESNGQNYTISVADPKHNETSVQLTVNKSLEGVNAVASGDNTIITVDLPADDYKGSTVINEYTDLNYSSIGQNLSGIENITVFPNPVRTGTVVNFGGYTFSKMEIYSLDGKLIRVTPLNPSDNYAEISLDDYSSGTYFLRLVGKDQIITRKILK